MGTYTKDPLREFCKALISCESYSGNEQGVARLIVEEAKKLGYDEAYTDACGNAVCVIKGALPGKKILLDGHMDTVPAVREKWTKDPFGAVVENGMIYGRGASDMKAAIAAMIYAGAEIIPIKDKIAGEIYISGTVCEERFEGIAFEKVIDAVKPDLILIGEASEMALKIGQRGRAEILIETFGKSAHSSNPQEGVNAVYAMSRYIQAMTAVPPKKHEVLGYGISELTDIMSEPYPGASVVPYHCMATVDRRLLTQETEESVLWEYQSIAESLAKDGPDLNIKISIAESEEKCYTGQTIGGKRFFPAWLMEREDPVVKMGLEALQRAGVEPLVSTYSFCTNGSMGAGTRHIPTLGFGPGMEKLAHIDDEFVSLDEVGVAMKVYKEICIGFLSK